MPVFPVLPPISQKPADEEYMNFGLEPDKIPNLIIMADLVVSVLSPHLSIKTTYPDMNYHNFKAVKNSNDKLPFFKIFRRETRETKVDLVLAVRGKSSIADASKFIGSIISPAMRIDPLATIAQNAVKQLQNQVNQEKENDNKVVGVYLVGFSMGCAIVDLALSILCAKENEEMKPKGIVWLAPVFPKSYFRYGLQRQLQTGLSTPSECGRDFEYGNQICLYLKGDPYYTKLTKKILNRTPQQDKCKIIEINGEQITKLHDVGSIRDTLWKTCNGNLLLLPLSGGGRRQQPRDASGRFAKRPAARARRA